MRSLVVTTDNGERPHDVVHIVVRDAVEVKENGVQLATKEEAACWIPAERRSIPPEVADELLEVPGCVRELERSVHHPFADRSVVIPNGTLVPKQEDRVKLAREVMGAANSLTFGAECLRWLGYQSDNKDGTTALTEAELKDVGSILAGRIAADISGNPDYSRHGRKIGRLLYIWKELGPKDEMSAFLTDRLDKNPDDATKLLDAFIGRAWGLESGLSHKSDFERSDFDTVANLVDPGIVLAALKKTFGTLLDNATFDKCWELNGDQQTACRFVAIFNKVQQEKVKEQATTEEAQSTKSASKQTPKQPK